MRDWLLGISAKAAKRAFWAFVAAAGGLAVVAAATWQGFVLAPPLLQAGFISAVLVLLTAAGASAAIWLNTPQATGNFGPKYLLWYVNPYRRVSWRFANFLALGGGVGQRVIIHGFQFSMRVNRGKGIVPRRAWVECVRTGTRRDVKFDVQNSGDGTTYRLAEDIDFIPAGIWLNALGWLERAGDGRHPEGMPQENFFRLFHDLTFHFEYEGGKFVRTFSRRELRELIQRFDEYSNPPPQPRVQVRAT